MLEDFDSPYYECSCTLFLRTPTCHHDGFSSFCVASLMVFAPWVTTSATFILVECRGTYTYRTTDGSGRRRRSSVVRDHDTCSSSSTHATKGRIDCLFGITGALFAYGDRSIDRSIDLNLGSRRLSSSADDGVKTATNDNFTPTTAERAPASAGNNQPTNQPTNHCSVPTVLSLLCDERYTHKSKRPAVASYQVLLEQRRGLC